MAKKDPRVDAYIARAAKFARPILEHLRALVHRACPDVVETIKWGHPSFEQRGLLCGMAAFKAHCAFGFWNASALKDPQKVLATVGKTAMGHLGRITSLEDLPSDRVLVAYVREAAALDAQGVKPAAARSRARGNGATKASKKVSIPKALRAALAKHSKARAGFVALSPSHQREYAEWILDAKTDSTRDKRLATALEWLADGKPRNWKYMRR